MLKSIGIISLVFLSSLYLFPVGILALPFDNSKLLLALFGLIWFVYDMATRNYRNSWLKDILVLSVYALAVSLCSIFSVTVNNTGDYAYGNYITSMWVWFAAAYLVVRIMRLVHGELNFRIIANYLIAVCVFQCVAAILNDEWSTFKRFADTYFYTGQDVIEGLGGTRRKSGFGALLDTAGVRFSAVLVMIPAVVIHLNDELKRRWLWIYLAAFAFITVEGNIIGRTTLVGATIGTIYFMLNLKALKDSDPVVNQWRVLGGISIFAVVLVSIVYLYNTNKAFHDDLRFGFEGVFSLVEKGSWEVSSNDRLKGMYVWPDNAHTWLIGDGYFDNPVNTDPYFIGEVTGGYYKGTDVGFLRFIYYSGTIGLFVFALFFIKCGSICAGIYPFYKTYFLLLTLLVFIIWLKVATDMFVIFAPFLAAGSLSIPRDKSILSAHMTSDQ